MTKILVCFDGTGNEPEDADPQLDDKEALEDENISNVLKLHLRAGGRLGDPVEALGQLSLYFPGPGTRGSMLRKVVETGLAPRSLEKIQDQALAQLRDVYVPGDEISVFGFSRGAAIARRFVSQLQKFGLVEDEKDAQSGQRLPVQFVGVWDTVLSEGIPDKDHDVRDPAELGETDGIGPDVGRVFHLVSIDDPRKVFTPTLFAPDDRVSEVWFPGVHSDVGGGYRQAGLSDIALEFMIEQAEREAGLTFFKAGTLESDDLKKAAAASNELVDPGDLLSQPNAVANDHVKCFDKFLKEFFKALGPRKVMALGVDIPVLHVSVIERGKKRQYRPTNLRNLRHTIWGQADAEYADFSNHFSGD